MGLRGNKKSVTNFSIILASIIFLSVIFSSGFVSALPEECNYPTDLPRSCGADSNCLGVQICLEGGFWSACDYTDSNTLTCDDREYYCDDTTSCAGGYAIYYTCSEGMCQDHTDNSDETGCQGKQCGSCIQSGCGIIPDGNWNTLDYLLSGTKTCDAVGVCSTSTCSYAHVCSDWDLFDDSPWVPDYLSVSACNAACDQDSDCGDNSCSETYYDSCDGFYLTDYNGNEIFDSLQINDFCEDTCNQDSCSCVGCTPDCSAMPVKPYCSTECEAELPSESTCNDGLDNDCDRYTDCEDSDCAGELGPTGAICCQSNEDCNPLDSDYCSGDSIMHDEGYCTQSNTCDKETYERYDCNEENYNSCDEDWTVHNDFTCTEDDGPRCILDLTTPLEDCNLLDDKYCGEKDQLRFINGYCADGACLTSDELLENCYYVERYCMDFKLWEETGFCDPVEEICDKDILEVQAFEQSCNDQEDNDCDGFIDCEDPDCDMTPPETTKRYGNPFYSNDFFHWINSFTLISLFATDPVGPNEQCASDSVITKYRTCLDPGCYEPILRTPEIIQQACSCPEETPWQTYTAEQPFNIPEDSEHCIEFYSEDALGNQEDITSQCVYVNTVGPTPIKTLEEPYTQWHPTPDLFEEDGVTPNQEHTYFYPEIVDKCWNDGEDQIDCWKVTKDTKITMDCEEVADHPPTIKGVCFKVEVDAEDATQQYCRQYEGEDWYQDGSCCVERTTIDYFKFKEESEHNLAYYCVDVLDNKGPVDDEKFKVIGDMFKIRINDKWNLISVPFKLLNDDPAEVFENTESIKTVWGYNAETKKWNVYRSDQISETNSLDSIEPGLGYWVLADCENPKDTFDNHLYGCGGPSGDKCDMLVVGGSLFNAGPVLPPSQKIVEGWNLIGYYGTDGRWWYQGPDAWYFKDSKEASCALYSLRNFNGGFNWNALVSYWEPYNTDGDSHTSVWQYYDDGCDEMNPGAGYWLASDVEDTYNPTTMCDDEMCNNPPTIY